jgi:hypothetical protein
MLVRLWITGLLLLSVGSARADHAHTVDHDGKGAFGAGVTMLAASFDTMLYSGNYEGIVPAVHWANERFAAGANVALYRLEKNGAGFYGLGDAVVHGQATLAGGHHAHVGVVAGVSVPLGDASRGMSMGHPMVMPALFGVIEYGRVEVSGTAGYSRAIGGQSDHDHGMWPIVEPMNMQELTWSAGGSYALTSKIDAGARLSGAVPIGSGDNRVIGAVRIGWDSGRFATAASLEAGIVGDPFTLRGVVSTAMSF